MPGPARAAGVTAAAPRGATHAVRGLTWLGLDLAVVAAPLVVALVSDPPPGRSVVEELSVACGFVGLAVMGLQFAVVSRLSAVNAPFGLDAVLHFHRQISFVAVVFILAHPALLIARRPELVDMLDPVRGGWVERSGLLSVAALLALIACSLWRRQLRLSYETWRLTHGALAVVAVAAALWHVDTVSRYLADPWTRGVWVAFALFFVGLLVNVRVAKPLRLLRRPWVVDAVSEEHEAAWTLRLRPDGHEGIRFLPGQFAWLRVDRSPFALREHPFSFSSSADDHEGVAFTVKAAGDFTSTVGELPVGTRAYIDGPYGVFSYERNEGPAFLFIAGGAGIAPIMSMLRTLADRGDRRPCLLLYGNRRWERTIFRDELELLAPRLDLEVVHVLEEPPEGWSGEAGHIDGELLDRHLPTVGPRARAFMCGPTPMMDAVLPLLHARGLPAEHLDHERFEMV